MHTCIDMTANRALIEATTGQSLSTIEWLGLLLLLLILLSLIVVLPGGTVLGALVAGALAGTLVTLVVLLRKLDLLRWHERSAIWEPTARLFRSMDLYPYVPREVMASGRYQPAGLVRVVDYPDPYPDRSTKIVSLEDLGAGSPAGEKCGWRPTAPRRLTDRGATAATAVVSSPSTNRSFGCPRRPHAALRRRPLRRADLPTIGRGGARRDLPVAASLPAW